MPTAKGVKKRRSRKKKQLSPDERKQRRLQRRFKSDIRTTFTNAGFTHIPSRDQELTFKGRTGDIDAIFIVDNVLVIVEDTTHSSDNVAAHVLKKADLVEHFKKSHAELVPFLAKTFPPLKRYFKNHGQVDQRECVVKYVYCSRYNIDEKYRTRHGHVFAFLEYGPLQYFLRLSRTIHKSARYELFKFLSVELEDILQPVRDEYHKYRALMLPEIKSGFPKDHRLVSFLIDPHTLIERAYVLRADSWRDQDALYQRLLVKGKIGSMRDYLVGEHRVFVNNIIVTLPSTTTFAATAKGKTEDQVETIASGDLTIPRQFNTIGIIDGQHRVFAYHEGVDKREKQIALLRDRQHLLVTGIIYPADISQGKAREFEAKLFLEINDKQKRVRGDLKQAIERIVNPYSPVAVAKSVLDRMSSTGPLSGILEAHFFDVGKVKTASIVSYGLRHIVDIDGATSLFGIWKGPGKTAVRRRSDKSALKDYTTFAASQLNLLVSGFKANVDSSLWTTDRKASRALTATTINGLVFCMRKLIEAKLVGKSFDEYKDAFSKMTVKFQPDLFPFKSSHWLALGDALFADCFLE